MRRQIERDSHQLWLKSKSLILKPTINQNTPIHKYEDYWEIPLDGRVISRFIIDISFIEIEILENDFELTLRVENDFAFENADNTQVISRENPASIGPILILLNHPLKLLHITQHGIVSLLFEEPFKLIVEPQDRFESWELWDKDGFGLLCGPGGGVF